MAEQGDAAVGSAICSPASSSSTPWSCSTISPGLVRAALAERLGDDPPWTPPPLAPQLVRPPASRADRLTGRYIHAEHDDIEDLIARAEEIARDDPNAIRLRR